MTRSAVTFVPWNIVLKKSFPPAKLVSPVSDWEVVLDIQASHARVNNVLYQKGEKAWGIPWVGCIPVSIYASIYVFVIETRLTNENEVNRLRAEVIVFDQEEWIQLQEHSTLHLENVIVNSLWHHRLPQISKRMLAIWLGSVEQVCASPVSYAIAEIAP